MSEALFYDVVVVGSGAGGMLAAIRAHDLGLKSIVIEKSDRYGGTSAVSGAGIWIPNNPDIGTDSKALALEYLTACTQGAVPPRKLERYVDAAPTLVEHLKRLGVQYYAHPQMSYPDYYPLLPGAQPHGRTMFVKPMEDGSVLGREFFRLREAYPEFKLLDKISLDLTEGAALLYKLPGWPRVLARLLWRYYGAFGWRRRTYRDRRLTGGNALVGGLRRAMIERDIPLLLKTRMTRILTENGRAAGVEADQMGRSLRVAAARGVILASGGFEHSQALRDKYLDQNTDERWSVTPRDNNVGDGLIAALQIGADTEFLNEAWWAPSIGVPSRHAPNTIRHQALFFERGYPHSLAVNRRGKRFVNEICSYHQFGQAMLRDNAASGANLPCWMIFDRQYRHQYPLAGLPPGRLAADSSLPPDWFDNFIFRADSLADLAQKIGLPAATLCATVSRFNEFARAGVDQEFGRGSNVYNLFFGDPKHKPSKVLGPVDRAPFYAVRIDLGDLGTKGGPRTDENAQVLDREGQPIPGLYAIGNVTGSITGGSYPGAGATLGPAMTFACIAAENIAGEQPQPRSAPQISQIIRGKVKP
jgi:3-oxosteroid 1-dehydrogenase